jgi:hypothetical protein
MREWRHNATRRPYARPTFSGLLDAQGHSVFSIEGVVDAKVSPSSCSCTIDATKSLVWLLSFQR